ncbi:MAG: hypothetical protein JWO86_5717 [Myxococcaceae bacterium]|nr:hypothetical protein [Myxococcaceae bacterium]
MLANQASALRPRSAAQRAASDQSEMFAPHGLTLARRRRLAYPAPPLLLFKKAFHEGLSSGAITLTFRRWKKPHVKPGGRYRCHPIGVLEVDDVTLVRVRDITARDATLSGFASRDALLDYLRELGTLDDDSEIHKGTLHPGGDGDRIPLALEADLSADDIETIRGKLAKMDRTSPWTAKTLGLIEKFPKIAASKLAAKVGRETLPFKVDVRKLKKLGLTQSFEVGYEISPRGRAYLDATKKRPTKRRTSR